MLKVAYREILLSLHRGCIGDDSSERVVGGVGMMHRPCLTYRGQYQCGLNVLFSGFLYIYIDLCICISFSNLYVL